MNCSDFDYFLPKTQIAQFPLKRRDASRLFVLHRKSGKMEHRSFRDLLDILHSGDALVLNDTRVKRARLLGRKATGGRIEAFFLRKAAPSEYEVLLNPSRMEPGCPIFFGEKRATLVGGNGIVKRIRFEGEGRGKEKKLERWLEQKGKVPLPPYIRRLPERSDLTRYQTVYAAKEGAVAAPTAGLHFTKTILRKIRKKGISLCPVTLHVGYGTFEPVRCERIEDHKMHEETFALSPGSAALLNRTQRAGGRIVAVGTTSCRLLETILRDSGSCLGAFPTVLTPLSLDFARDPSRDPEPVEGRAGGALCAEPPAIHHRKLQDGNCFRPMKGWTDLFITPPYSFQGTDALLTNFHLPKSTLFMLVSAFAGLDLIRKAYQEAVRAGYRFYSYGDAMLIL